MAVFLKKSLPLRHHPSLGHRPIAVEDRRDDYDEQREPQRDSSRVRHPSSNSRPSPSSAAMAMTAHASGSGTPLDAM